jgi:adenine-specific DNA-methyltransferase
MVKNIFEEYKNDNIDIFESIYLLEKKSITEEEAKEKGAIYTPKYIVEYMIENLDYDINKKITDPCTGHGIYVFSLLLYVKNKYKMSGNVLLQWFKDKVTCIDINPIVIEEFKNLLEIFFNKENCYNINFDNVLNQDFLTYQEKCDFIIGNPPYVRTKNIDSEYLLFIRNHFKSCKKGNVDLYYSFLEHSNNISSKTIFIVPNSYTHNISAKTLRTEIRKNLNKIIDFKDKMIFSNARTYTSIILLDNKNNEFIKYANDIDKKPILFKNDLLNNDKWYFEELPSGNLYLEKYAKIYGEIATLKNNLFILNELEEENECYIKEIEGKKYLIEKNICVDFYKISKIKTKKDLTTLKKKIIFPYNKEDFKILKESYFYENYPLTFKYLEDMKHILNNRDKGKVDKYDNWFAYGRKQGINHFKSDSEFVLVPKLIHKSTKVHKLTYKELENNFFLGLAGYIVEVFDKEDTQLVIDALNSNEFFHYCSNVGKVWKGNAESAYYGISTKDLKSFSFN